MPITVSVQFYLFFHKYSREYHNNSSLVSLMFNANSLYRLLKLFQDYFTTFLVPNRYVSRAVVFSIMLPLLCKYMITLYIFRLVFDGFYLLRFLTLYILQTLILISSGSDLRAKYQSNVVQRVHLRSKICNCSFSTAIFVFVTICNIISLAKIDQYPVAFAFRAKYISLKFFSLEIYFILYQNRNKNSGPNIVLRNKLHHHIENMLFLNTSLKMLQIYYCGIHSWGTVSYLCKVNSDAFISYPLKELTIMPKTLLKLSLSPNWKQALTPLDFGKLKLGVKSSRRMLGTAAQKTFTDRLLIPAIRRVLICSRANRSDGSYGEAIGTGFHMTVPKFLLGSELKLLVKSMRDIAKESADLAPYRHFVFVVSSFGFKSPMYGPDYTSILDTMVDWSQLDPQRCLENVEAMGKRFGGRSIKTDFYGMSLGSFGGFSGKGRSGSFLTPSKVMVYNDIKYPFTMSNPGVNGKVSGPWIPEEMRNTFRHQDGHHLKNMRWYNARVSEYQGHQFTTRLEIRLPAISATTAYVDVLVAMLKSSLADEAFIHIDSAIYLQYVGLMANLLSYLAEKCLGSVLLQSFSGLYLSAYMLNNLMHSDQSLTDSSNFVSSSRCDKNRLCFLPGAFAVDGDRVMFGHTFDSTSIQQAFPGAVIFDSTEEYMSSRFQDGYVRGTNVPEAFYDLFNNTETALEGLLSTRSNTFPLAPVTCPTLQAYSELITDSVIPIEKAFDHCPLFCLMQYGFGTKFAAYFLEQFGAKYITFLKDGDCYLDVLGFSNVPSKAFLSKVDAKPVAEPMCITERTYFLLPLPHRDSCTPADFKNELAAYMDG
ncbi:uncharacterized protein EV154DRAFT_589035 [Mucor mucedo]|uniref:uncharacterized protein n=1 Tax=Mucor mucedo TaxID=29922 RepID=UPI00221FC27E|nr:uncharacterized protein EV154DRAFT_589035 [Mucor mucedo]KAI7890971.1 hypothetical protein EV154DRAFT_589035 [Mucor mucedo]